MSSKATTDFLSKARNEGYEVTDNVTKVNRYGKQYTQHTVRTKQLSGTARVARGVLAAAVTLGTGVVPTLVSTDFRHRIWDPATKGHREKKILDEEKDIEEIERKRIINEKTGKTDLVKRLGYDPKNRATMQAYAKENPHLVQRAVGGHLVIPNPSRSSFIFIKGGDLSDPKNFTSFRIESKSGKPLKPLTFERIMNCVSAGYTELQEKRNEMIAKLSERHAKKAKFPNEHGYIKGTDEYKKAYDEFYTATKDAWVKEYEKKLNQGSYMVDVKNKHFRFYTGDIYKKYNYNELKDVLGSKKYGYRIDMSDELSKEVDEIWKSTRGKKLPNERPIKPTSDDQKSLPQLEDDDEESEIPLKTPSKKPSSILDTGYLSGPEEHHLFDSDLDSDLD